jgi:hypothetical protein
VSETVPESSSGGNVFTRKLGPLPMWGWMAVVLLLAIAYYFMHKQASSSSSGNTSGAASSPSSLNTPGGVDSSLVPQFVNQVYNQETPPAAPNVTVNNQVPGSTGVISSEPPPLTEPKYGQAGPPNSSYQAITPQEASTLQSNNNLYNTAGRKAQRPFIWNGSAYVPNTNPISGNYQYYAGPLETKEINAATSKKK